MHTLHALTGDTHWHAKWCIHLCKCMERGGDKSTKWV